MPVGYLDVPTGVDVGRKRELVKAIYDALHEAYPFPDDTRIFLREWPLDSASQNGLTSWRSTALCSRTTSSESKTKQRPTPKRQHCRWVRSLRRADPADRWPVRTAMSFRRLVSLHGAKATAGRHE